MSHPRKRKNRENDAKEGKEREVKSKLEDEKQLEEKVELKPSLSPMHQQMLDVILGPYLEDDALDALQPQEKARLLYLMLYPDQMTGSDVLFFKNHNLLDNIIFIHQIFLHEHPQNRVSGDPGAFAKEFLKGRDPESLHEEEAAHIDPATAMFAGTGVFEDVVYYFTDEGFPGPVLTEPRGLLGLTTRNTDPPVTKAGIIEYLSQMISAKLSTLPEPISAEFKDPRYTKSMSEALDFLLIKDHMPLDYIDKRGIDTTLNDIQAYLKYPKVQDAINKDIIQILDAKAMQILEKALQKEEKFVKYFLKNGTDFYSETEIINWGSKNIEKIARLYYQPHVRKMIEFQVENNLDFDPLEMLEDTEMQVVRIANSFAKPEIFELIESEDLSFHDFYDHFKFYDRILSHETVRDFLKKGIFSHNILQVFSKNNHDIEGFCQIMHKHSNLKSLLENTIISAIDLSTILKKIGLDETLKVADLFIQHYPVFSIGQLTFMDIAKLPIDARNTLSATMQLLKEHKLDDFAGLLIAQRQLTFPNIILYGPEVMLRVIQRAHQPQNAAIIFQGGLLVPFIIADTVMALIRERQVNSPEIKRNPR